MRRRVKIIEAERIALMLREQNIATMEADLGLPGAERPEPFFVMSTSIDLIRKHASHLAPAWVTEPKSLTDVRAPEGVFILVPPTDYGYG